MSAAEMFYNGCMWYAALTIVLVLIGTAVIELTGRSK